MAHFKQPTQICYGEKTVNIIETLPLHHAMLVTDPFMVKAGFAERVKSVLDRASIPCDLFDNVEPEPSLETITEGAYALLKNKSDAVIALGGGSAIDAAKAIMYFAHKAQKNKEKPLLVVIPTTSGTGSEVTSFSVITDTKSQTKIPVVDDLLIPDLALLDPRFTRTVPPAITADTGMDVLTHAIEAYVSVDSNIFADIYSERAIKYVFRYLVRAFQNGDDMRARERMMVASCMAGTAFNNCGLGIAHSLAHSLGAIFHIPHGRANAVLLPYSVRFNALEAGEKYQKIAKLVGLPASSIDIGTKSLLLAIENLNEQLEIPCRIRELNIDESDFRNALNELADKAFHDPCCKKNPRKPSREEIVHLFQDAW